MKHIVTLTISNPSHEHISLRRRQSTTNYMVEARDEAEAIFRASNHFKKLGNYVHNAVIAEGAMKRHAEEQDDAGMSDYEHYMQTKDKKRQVEPLPSAMPSDTRLKPLPKAKKGVRIGSTNKFGHYTPGMREDDGDDSEEGMRRRARRDGRGNDEDDGDDSEEGMRRRARRDGRGPVEEEVEQIDEVAKWRKSDREQFPHERGEEPFPAGMRDHPDYLSKKKKTFMHPRPSKNPKDASYYRSTGDVYSSHLDDIGGGDRKIPLNRNGEPELSTDYLKDREQNLPRRKGKIVKTALKRAMLARKQQKEEVEQIDELSKGTLASYITKASRQSSALHSLGKEFDNDKHMYAKKALNAKTPKTKEKAKADMETSGRLAKTFTRKAHNRTAGISRAAVKLAKEEVEQIDELSPGTYRAAAEKRRQQADDIIISNNKFGIDNSPDDLAASDSLLKKADKLIDAASRRNRDRLFNAAQAQKNAALSAATKRLLKVNGKPRFTKANEEAQVPNIQQVRRLAVGGAVEGKSKGAETTRLQNAMAHLQRVGGDINKVQPRHRKTLNDFSGHILNAVVKSPSAMNAALRNLRKEEVVNEKAPPGAKYERMVKHIKDKYSEDGTLTPKEKAIAYATAWEAKNSGK